MMSEETAEDTCVASATQSLQQTHINGDKDEDKSSPEPTPTAANGNGNTGDDHKDEEDTNHGAETQEQEPEDHENGEPTEPANNGKELESKVVIHFFETYVV